MADISSKNTTKDSESDKNKEKLILGISVIQSIVSKVISDPTQIISGLKQILYFYHLIPAEWKKKAFWIFEKLWGKKKVVISTEPEKTKRSYNIKFDNDKLTKLYDFLPQIDQAILLQGKEMQDLINKYLHSDSDEIKQEVETRYGQRGLNIVNMLTTHDVEYLLDELTEPFEAKIVESIFNKWAQDYDSIAILISPSNLDKPQEIKKRILTVTKVTSKKYILINLSGKMEDCTNFINLIYKMKEKKEINYIDLKLDIADSGFCKSLRIKINFK